MKLLVQHNPVFVKDLISGQETLQYMSVDLVTLADLDLDDIEQEFDYYGTVTGSYFCDLTEEEKYSEVAFHINTIYRTGAVATIIVEDKYADYIYSGFVNRIQIIKDKIKHGYSAIGTVTY